MNENSFLLFHNIYFLLSVLELQRYIQEFVLCFFALEISVLKSLTSDLSKQTFKLWLAFTD